MKIYVTKHALKFKGTVTGISEHEVEYSDFKTTPSIKEAYLLLDKVGMLKDNDKDFKRTKLEAIIQVLKMIDKKKLALKKELAALEVKELDLEAILENTST